MSSFSLRCATRLLLAAVVLLLLHAPSARAESGPWALFDGTTAIADPDAGDSGNVELGARFSVDTPASGAYWLTKVRYYRAPNRPINTNRVNVYDSSGRMLTRGSLDVAAGASGVVDVPLAEPLRLTPGKTYTVSYSAPTGHYALDRGAFAAARTVGPVRFPADAGVYQYGGGFPGDSWNSSGYYVSPVVSLDTGASSPAEPPSTGPWALFDGSTSIADPAAADAARVELGVRFSVAQPATGAYTARAVRFYRAPLHPMVENRVWVYDEAGTIVARGEAIGEGGPSGVVDVLLNAPLRLTPGHTYTASYLATDGHYAVNRGAFAAGRTVGPLRFPADAGVYQYGGGFPTATWGSSSYYVSPLVGLDT